MGVPADGDDMMLETRELVSLLVLLMWAWVKWLVITDEEPFVVVEYVLVSVSFSLSPPNPKDVPESVPKSIPNCRSSLLWGIWPGISTADAGILDGGGSFDF